MPLFTVKELHYKFDADILNSTHAKPKTKKLHLKVNLS